MRKVIMATMVAACITLCAAVWPQSKVVEETSVPPPTPAVNAPEAPVEELKAEVKATPPAEKEKAVSPQADISQEVSPEPEPVPTETPTAPEVQPKPEPAETSEAVHKSTAEPTYEPAVEQATDIPQSGDMVYVEGFGWIESQGPNQVDYAEDMYENGNKIGSMG